MSHTVKQAESVNQEWHALKNQWVENPQAEIARLKQDSAIAKAFSQVGKRIELSNEGWIAYGHSLEAQSRFGDRYFVLNHGQNLDLMVLNIFTKELVKRAEPAKNVSGFHILRHDAFLKDAQDWNVSQAKSTLTDEIDHEYRTELLCADGYLANFRHAESALSFFHGLTNIAKYGSFTGDIYKKIIRHYVNSPSAEDQAISDLKRIARELPEGGNLYTICIPKEKFEGIGYRAHPFGHPCDHYYGESESEVLEDLQRRKAKFCSMGRSEYVPPQYRLLNKKLTKENGVAIFVNSTLSRKKVRETKAAVQKVVIDLLSSAPLPKNNWWPFSVSF